MEHHDVSEVPIVGRGGHTTKPVHTNNLGIKHVMIHDQSVSCELGEDMLERVSQFHRAIDVASSEREYRESVERGRQRGLDIVNAQRELARSKRSECETFIRQCHEEDAEKKRRNAANEAKAKAFIDFKQLVTTKSKRRTVLFLANSLRKLLKHFWFRRDHKAVWV
jgi:hypothetical protein